MNENLNFVAAVAAANTQISTHAVVKLASDTGTIYSIVNAAGYPPDLYVAIKEIYSGINAVAYNAELLSQAAMDTSVMAAESADVSKEAEALLSDANGNSERLTEIVDKLIKFDGLMVRKKALNPLIADDLITMVHTAAVDGENAKSLISAGLL